MTAHIAGVPLEETLLPLLSGLGGGLVLARAWVAGRTGRRTGRRRYDGDVPSRGDS